MRNVAHFDGLLVPIWPAFRAQLHLDCLNHLVAHFPGTPQLAQLMRQLLYGLQNLVLEAGDIIGYVCGSGCTGIGYWWGRVGSCVGFVGFTRLFVERGAD